MLLHGEKCSLRSVGSKDIDTILLWENDSEVRRFGDSEKDLVGALLFLLNNDAAGFITGICLPIDGGFSAYSGV